MDIRSPKGTTVIADSGWPVPRTCGSTVQEIVSAIPLRQAGKPRDIAGACLFLASDLSAYITGTTIDVNGGSHVH